MTDASSYSFKKLLSINANSPSSPQLYYQTSNTDFKKLPWASCLQIINQIADAINQLIGNDNAVIGICHENSLLWDLTQLAIKHSKNTLLGLNHHDSDDSLSKLLSSTKAKLIISSPTLKNKLASLKANNLIILELSNGKISVDTSSATKSKGDTFSHPKNACEIICTSGTTGTPKIYYYSEEQILMACTAIAEQFEGELDVIKKNLSWMPLAIPFQRMLNYISLFNNKVIYYIDDPKTIIKICATTQPELIAAVPRLYQKIFEEIYKKITNAPLIGTLSRLLSNKMCDHILTTKEKMLFFGAHKLIRVIFLKAMGSNLKFLLSGSAPLPKWLETFYRNIGLTILQAYGLSENIIPITLSTSKEYRIGSVGKVLSPNQIDIRDKQIFIKSKGIHLNAKLDDTNFLNTGDKGCFLYHQGRATDYFKTLTGRRIYPVKIEDLLKRLIGMNFICVMGNELKIPCAILDANKNFFRYYADKSKLKKQLSKLMRPLNPYEKPAVFIIKKNEFSVQSGEITSNSKVRRRIIHEKYIHSLTNIILNLPAHSQEHIEVIYD